MFGKLESVAQRTTKPDYLLKVTAPVRSTPGFHGPRNAGAQQAMLLITLSTTRQVLMPSKGFASAPQRRFHSQLFISAPKNTRAAL
ncbi:hypothetical protein CEXT_622941 [Caerostris extrusa]|uniref:Uncharacterized protein n=1 Tax=Caerostris extrusa TaxID=172846 RepID=A0AAV4XUY3_CAEEX|nr:hypothetical protein CEXT_622941 [Caerostris extrusa]